MPIVSIGYDNTIDENEWATIAPVLGVNHTVQYGATPTIVTTADRTVRIPAGALAGWGVQDTITGTTDLALGTVASGSRWDTLVLRRDWVNNVSTLRIVAGTSTKAISASIESNPGTLADQPMALLRVTAGFSAIQELVDIREWRYPVVFRFDTNLPDPAGYQYGQILVQDVQNFGVDVLVRRGGTGADALWESLNRSGWYDVNIGTTLGAGVAPPQYQIAGGRVNFRGEAGPKTTPWSSGPGKGLGQVPTEVAPSFTRVFPIALKNMSDRDYLAGRVYIEPTGQITLDIPEVAGLTVGSVDYSSINYDLGS